MKYRDLKKYKYGMMEDMPVQLPFTPPLNAPNCHSYSGQFLQIDDNGLLIIKKGYAWDGCSSLTWDDKTNMRAGAVHDAGFQLMRMGVIPTNYFQAFNDLFRDILIQDGMGRVRAWYYWKAVSTFAKPACTKALSQDMQILEAP